MSIQLKRSNTANIDTSYVLDAGQIGIDTMSGTNSSSTPFAFKIGDGTTTWANLPWSDMSVHHSHSGYLSTTGTAAAATKLATARTVRTNLASTSTASFNGTANITPGVTGTLGVSNGGTGVTTLAALKTALGISDSGSSGESTLTADLTIKGTNEYGAINIKYEPCTTSASMTIVGHVNNGYTSDDRFGFTGYKVYYTMTNTYFGPSSNQYSYTLGNSSYKWSTVYATTGSIQTSDRSAKHNIVYLSDAESVTVNVQGKSRQAVTLTDIMELVNVLEPATFEYNNNTSSSNPEDYQLGLIADDLENLNIFPYIGGRWSWEEQPEIRTDDGIILQDATAAGSTLGLKPIPLAVAALTCCKYLLQRVETLEDKLNA